MQKIAFSLTNCYMILAEDIYFFNAVFYIMYNDIHTSNYANVGDVMVIGDLLLRD